jgi:uncharacterized protein YegP (UPF0339 family)
MKSMFQINVYLDDNKEWRWQAVHRNGRIMADSGEGYKRRGDCVGAFNRLTGALQDGNWNYDVETKDSK